MVGQRVGGMNVFAGGLALYKGGKEIRALGVSGDTWCADHDTAGGVSKGGFGHPTCGGKEADVAKEIGAGAVVQ